MRGRRAPVGEAAFVRFLAPHLVDLLIAGLKRFGSSVQLGVEGVAQLIRRDLQIDQALLLLVDADLADPVVLQHGQDADQDHQQRHEEPQRGGSASDLIRVHHLLP